MIESPILTPHIFIINQNKLNQWFCWEGIWEKNKILMIQILYSKEWQISCFYSFYGLVTTFNFLLHFLENSLLSSYKSFMKIKQFDQPSAVKCLQYLSHVVSQFFHWHIFDFFLCQHVRTCSVLLHCTWQRT